MLEKFAVSQQAKKYPILTETEVPFPHFHEPVGKLHVWARWIQSTPSHYVNLRSILISYTYSLAQIIQVNF